jgi:hypothetical protein
MDCPINTATGHQIFLIGRQVTGCILERELPGYPALGRAPQILEPIVLHVFKPAECLVYHLCPELTLSERLATTA